MCTYYYLHYHHVAPCAKDVEYALHYSYCANSTIELAGPSGFGSSPLSFVSSLSMNSSHVNGNIEAQLVQKPCDDLTYTPDYVGDNPGTVLRDFSREDAGHNNPCITGGCLVSQHCSSGGCRPEDLGGKWTCCKCQRGGNTYAYCVHPMKKVPDTLCYHVVCQDCSADA